MPERARKAEGLCPPLGPRRKCSQCTWAGGPAGVAGGGDHRVVHGRRAAHQVGAGLLGGEEGRDVEPVAVGVPVEGHPGARQPGANTSTFVRAAAHVQGVGRAAQAYRTPARYDRKGVMPMPPAIISWWRAVRTGEEVARPRGLDGVARRELLVDEGRAAGAAPDAPHDDP